MTFANHSDLQRVIDKCMDNGCLLLLFIYDDDSCSEMTALWNSEEVTSAINAYKCEKIQFNSGSLEYVNFTQYYPVLVTPSIFIINNDGVPLDMLYGNLTSKELTKKINKAIEAHRSGKTRLLLTQPPLTTQRDSNKAVRSVHPSSVINHRKATQRDKVDYNKRAQQTTNSSSMATSDAGRSVHRTVGYRDTKLYSRAKPFSSSNTCRLQLRVVNSNNKLIQQFHPSDTLSVVKEYASKELGIPIDDIILEKSYPAYRFVVEDEVKTLSELQLTPTAMLIVKQKMTDSWSSMMLSRVFDVLFYLLSLIVWPLQLLGGFIYGPSTGSSSASQTRRRSQSNARPNNTKGNSWQRRGNIASFRQGNDDDDDDQNTYNGNSTQQQ